jgi:tetratricopeptide (TPR) repeat protein
VPKYDHGVSTFEGSTAGPQAANTAARELAKAFGDVLSARVVMAQRLCALQEALSARGQHKAAVGAAKEASLQVRALAGARPDRWSNKLVSALACLAGCLEKDGRLDEALRTQHEAVDLAAQRAADDPEAKRLYSVNLLLWSGLLEKTGHQDQALEAVQRSVAARRELRAAAAEGSEQALALGLTVLSQLFGRLGRYGESLASAEEAVQVYMGLLPASPADIGPKLAGLVVKLAQRAGEAGSPGEVAGLLQGCAGLARSLLADKDLGDAGRAVLLALLARSLYVLSVPMLPAGQHAEALPLLEESVAVFREVVGSGKPGSQEELAMALNNLGSCSYALGRNEEGLRLFEEATSINRQLVNSGTTRLVPRLGALLQNLAQAQRDAGRYEEALATAEEAVGLCRRPAPGDLGARLAEGRALMVLASALIGAERAEDAVGPSREAVTLHRVLAVGGTAFLRAQLSGSLQLCALCLLVASGPEDAWQAAYEALTIERQLRDEHPTTANAYLALALQTAANCAAVADCPGAALPLLEEAIGSLRPSAVAEPGKLGLLLGTIMVSLALVLAASDRLEEAVCSFKEAAQVLQHPDVPASRARDATLSSALGQLAGCLGSLGRDDEADAAREESGFLGSWSGAANDALLKAETFILNAVVLPQRGPGFYPSDIRAINRNLFTL